MTDTNVSNGKSTLTLYTDGMQEGVYNLNIKYKGTADYNPTILNTTFTLKEFSWTNLSDWSWKKYSGTGSTNYTAPSISNGIMNMGRVYLVLLSDFIPVRNEAFTLLFQVKSTYSGNRAVLGEYTTTVNNEYKYTSNGLRITFSDVGYFSDDDWHEVAYVVNEGLCKIYVDGDDTGLSKDFTNLSNFYLMFYAGKDNSLYMKDLYYEYSVFY